MAATELSILSGGVTGWGLAMSGAMPATGAILVALAVYVLVWRIEYALLLRRYNYRLEKGCAVQWPVMANELIVGFISDEKLARIQRDTLVAQCGPGAFFSGLLGQLALLLAGLAVLILAYGFTLMAWDAEQGMAVLTMLAAPTAVMHGLAQAQIDTLNTLIHLYVIALTLLVIYCGRPKHERVVAQCAFAQVRNGNMPSPREHITIGPSATHANQVWAQTR